jgi:hypothetical protein
MPQCNAPASGLSAQCVINPYFARAQAPRGITRVSPVSLNESRGRSLLLSRTVNCITYAGFTVCYFPRAGDFRGPAEGAAGTMFFEPDGVIFLNLPCPVK